MNPEPRFISLREALTIHNMQVSTFGGANGIRDEGMLESAMGRPVNRWNYEGASIPRLAADYAFGIARNHPFVDGNKRAAFMVAYAFLGLNGYRFTATEAEVVIMFLSLAAGEVDDDKLADWFSEHTVAITSREDSA